MLKLIESGQNRLKPDKLHANAAQRACDNPLTISQPTDCHISLLL
ncbi:MAG: hypothetical protein R3B08_07945 [Nitrospira sp.]